MIKMLRGFHFGKKFVDDIKEQQQEQEPIKAIKLTKLKCENCGSNLSLSNVVNGVVKCQYCGAEYVQGDTQETKIEKVEKDLYCDDDTYSEVIPSPSEYIKINIYGKERKFYIANTRIHRIYSDDTCRRLDGSIDSNVIGDKVEINLIEM